MYWAGYFGHTGQEANSNITRTVWTCIHKIPKQWACFNRHRWIQVLKLCNHYSASLTIAHFFISLYHNVFQLSIHQMVQRWSPTPGFQLASLAPLRGSMFLTVIPYKVLTLSLIGLDWVMHSSLNNYYGQEDALLWLAQPEPCATPVVRVIGRSHRH